MTYIPDFFFRLSHIIDFFVVNADICIVNTYILTTLSLLLIFSSTACDEPLCKMGLSKLSTLYMFLFQISSLLQLKCHVSLSFCEIFFSNCDNSVSSQASELCPVSERTRTYIPIVNGRGQWPYHTVHCTFVTTAGDKETPAKGNHFL